MKKLFLFTTAVLVATSISVAPTRAQGQQAPPTPPAAKPADKATTIAGKWSVAIDTGQGSMESILEIKLDGKKVTGTLTGQQGTTPIEGEYTDPKLTFAMTFDTPNGSIPVTFTCSLKDDVFTGTADAGQMGSFPMRAQRVKDKN
jgi:hypothetical protein